VDADEKSRRVLEISLKKAGYGVESVSSARAALEWMGDHTPSLIVSDTNLPGQSGFDFCGRVKENLDWEPIPFLFLTDSKSSDSRRRGYELGVEDYLTKPVYVKEVTSRVEMLLQRRQKELLAVADAEEKRGDLESVMLIDLLQAMEDHRQSGTVELEREGRRGIVYFKDGKAVDAAVGKLRGAEAVYRLMQWPSGQFVIRYVAEVNRRDRVSLPTQDLILEGMRQLERFEGLIASAPAGDRVFEVNYRALADHIRTLPEEVNGLIRLFDGFRTVEDILEDSPIGSVNALTALERLRAQELIYDVTPQRRSDQEPEAEGTAEAERPDLGSWLGAASGEEASRSGRPETEAEKVRRRREERKRRKGTARRGDEGPEVEERQLWATEAQRRKRTVDVPVVTLPAMASAPSASAVVARAPIAAPAQAPSGFSDLQQELEALEAQAEQLRREKERLEQERMGRAEARRKEEAELARVEAQRAVRAQVERQAREEEERRSREQAEAEQVRQRILEAQALTAQLQLEREALAEAVAREREESERMAREARAEVEAEMRDRRAQLDAEVERMREELGRRKAEIEGREQELALEIERQREEEQDARQRIAAERQAREEAERRAAEEARRASAERQAREEVERRSAVEAARLAHELAEADRLARDKAERLARQEADRLAREEADRAALEQAALLARQEAARLALEQEAAELLALQEMEREEAARLAREQAEREEAEAQAREEAAAFARASAEREEAARLASESATPKVDDARIRKEESEAKAAAISALAEAARRSRRPVAEPPVQDRKDELAAAEREAEEERRRQAERAEAERKEAQRKEAERLAAAQRKESERKDAQRKESERKDAQRKESERKAAERKEASAAASTVVPALSKPTSAPPDVTAPQPGKQPATSTEERILNPSTESPHPEDAFFAQSHDDLYDYAEPAHGGSSRTPMIVIGAVVIAVLVGVGWYATRDEPDTATETNPTVKERPEIKSPGGGETLANKGNDGLADKAVTRRAEELGVRTVENTRGLGELYAVAGMGDEPDAGDPDNAAPPEADAEAPEDKTPTDAPPEEKVTPPPVEKATPPPVEKVTPPPVEKVTPPPVEKVTPPPVEKVTPPPVEKVTPPPVEKAPADVNVSIQKGRRLVQSGNYAGAIAELQQAAAIQPGNYQVNFLLGQAYYNSGDNANGLRYLERAVRANPNAADAWMSLGSAYMAAGQNSKGIEAYKKYVQLRPTGKNTEMVQRILAQYQ